MLCELFPQEKIQGPRITYLHLIMCTLLFATDEVINYNELISCSQCIIAGCCQTLISMSIRRFTNLDEEKLLYSIYFQGLVQLMQEIHFTEFNQKLCAKQ